MKKITLSLAISLGFLFLITGAFGVPLSTPLINTGVDSDAEGTLYWQSEAQSFTGSVVVKNLDVFYSSEPSGWGADGYQIKLEQSFLEPGGQFLGSVGRVWDKTAGTNVGESNTHDQLLALAQTHNLVGYLFFGYFEFLNPSTIRYHDTLGSSTDISAQADGSFLIPFYADFSWHTNGEEQLIHEGVTYPTGDIVMPIGDYNATFLITRQVNYTWSDPLLANDVAFSVVPEPTTMILLGLGLVGLAGMRRKLKK